MAATRTIRVFLSSPGDVQLERDQARDVVLELNATLRALLPDRDVRLELLRWETDTHPDIGTDPQQVVDEQIPTDYDVFVGLMWSRFGTPTSRAGSGTEHEFRSAYAGWQEHRRPAHILFYFCEAPIPALQALESADQLKAVHALRTELVHKGLVGSYDDRDHFDSRLRTDLVRVLGRLLHAGPRPTPRAAAADRVAGADRAMALSRVEELAAEYQRIRDTMPPGDSRTRRMEVLASTMRTLAPATVPVLPELTRSDSAGMRLAAVSALQAAPDMRYLDWLVDRVAEEKPFVGYHAAVALVATAREATEDDLDRVEQAVARAQALSARLPSDADRTQTLRFAAEELRRRRSRG